MDDKDTPSASASASFPTSSPSELEPPEWLQRTTLLLGRSGVAALHDTRVLLVGLGGVGSYVAEFLVRAGVGSLAIVDGDVVDVTNKNRQLPALDSTIGLPKSQVMSQRLLDINPHLNLVVRQEFLTPDTAGDVFLDEVAEELDRGAPPKLALLAAATRRGGVRVVSSMGAGGRMDPLAVRIVDISETYGDPFAAACRRGLRRQYGIHNGVTVVFSTEPCRSTSMALASAARYKRSYYGTISFIPALFGLTIAAHIVNAVTDGPMVAAAEEQRKNVRRMREAATGGKGTAAAAAAAVGGGGGGGGGPTRARGRLSSSRTVAGLSTPRNGATKDANQQQEPHLLPLNLSLQSPHPPPPQQQQQQPPPPPSLSAMNESEPPQCGTGCGSGSPAGWGGLQGRPLAEAVQRGSGFEGADI
ncbi:hypothetical protein VOLCADRAFT_90052 [Volvox carteri f. nagariensis]|uniref:THIF-type NAD/FAD binding fold domain-containing protein n=1 Tax=Volvox carteri f. nagariensis TaxID=3068 RepID=D8TTD1_VOLCA|nr:uncharacterized protein VOLCADRAFT_90052 [Volvox carteri f. nagariensis]EFJ49284.1 hypothetical protein VOLCADRAFT_90052 [Volvox carteri f. nagariensis]|eukprot:XP_002949732.1 hypothetical protein VOLCADRAFT_90052 [Volvox carteri f. nagariensis]